MEDRVHRSLLESVLRRSVPLAAEGQGDAELLRRFAANRDPTAFEALLCRHGPMVWSVCRALLPRESDAEDAFQACFLALIQSAGSIRVPGAWLHGVACRIAMSMRRTAGRRRRREQVAAAQEAALPVADETWDRLRLAMHEEIGRLPESLRAPFVLCELQGLGQGEAAAALGWKLGTLSGRLTRARQHLLQRLTQRDIPVGLAIATAVIGTATAPAAVLTRAATLARCGDDLNGGVSASILELARGATEVSMTRRKLLAIAAVLMIGTTSTVIPLTLAQRPAGQPPSGAQSPSTGNYRVKPAVTSGWEYKVVPLTADDTPAACERILNDLGAQGWELCGKETFRDGGNPRDGLLSALIFKRPRTATATTIEPSVDTAGSPPASLPSRRPSDSFASGQRSKNETKAIMLKIMLKHATAADAAKILSQLFSDHNLRIVPDERTNSLLIMTPENVQAEITGVLETLDTPQEGGKRVTR